MKLFGSLKEIINLVFRNSSSNEVTINPNTAGTSDDVTIDLPPVVGPTSDVLVSEDATQTLTNKSISGAQIDSGTIPDAQISESSVTQHEGAIDHDNILNGANASGVHGVTGDVVGTTDTQDLNNKTFINSVSIQEQAATPANPPAGDQKIYPKTGGNWYTLDSSGAETDLVGDDTTNTLTNKSIDAANNTITNITNSEIEANAGIHATKIHDGSVSNNDFERVGTAGTDGSDELVITDDAQTLTNKDIDGGTASDTSRITLPKNTTTNLDGLTDKEGTVAYDTDKDNIVFNDGTNWLEVGSGAGGGGINYVTNPDAEVDVSDWAASGVNFTVARTTTTAEILRGDASFKLSANASATTSDYIDCDLGTLAQADEGKRLSISFDVKGLTGYEAGDIEVVIIADPTGTPVEIVPSYTEIPAASTKFQAYFGATDETDYVLRFKAATAGSAHTYSLSVDNVIVGPEESVQATPISEWTDFTPTGTWTTNTTYYGKYRRVGDSIETRCTISLSGAPNATSLRIDVPLGLTIDTAKLASVIDRNVFGYGYLYLTATSSRYPAYSFYYTNSAFIVGYGETGFDGNNVTRDQVDENEPALWSSGDDITLTFKAPISEWAGNSVGLTNSRVEFASNSSTTDVDDTFSFAYGSSGSLVPSITAAVTGDAIRQKRVQFSTPIQPTDKITVQIQNAGNGLWMDMNESFGYCPYTQMATKSYGIGISPVGGSDTQINIFFGRAGTQPNSTTYGAAGINYPRVAGDRWRISKSSTPSSVGVSDEQIQEVSHYTNESSSGSNITLTSSSNRQLYYSITSDIDITLPSSGVSTGDTWTITVEQEDGDVATIKSSDGDTVDTIGTSAAVSSSKGTITLFAVQNTPTDATHWKIVSVSEEGSYTPVSVGTDANIDSVDFTAGSTTKPWWKYTRYNNTVAVSGLVNIDPTSANTNTIVEASLPVATNISSSRELGGIAVRQSTGVTVETGFIYGQTTDEGWELRLRPTHTTAANYGITFTYDLT